MGFERSGFGMFLRSGDAADEVFLRGLGFGTRFLAS